jgi:hypothetical protein
MTITYMAIPKVRVSFGGVVTDGLINATIEMAENNYWTSQLNFRNTPAIYPATVDVNTSVLIDVQDGAVGGAWTNLFTGSVLFPDHSFNGKSATIGLQCVGVGYALNMMNVAQEYGAQSRCPARDTIQGILTNAAEGIIPKFVEHYITSAYDSGYTINTDHVVNLAGSIPYIVFPWKPANKCLDDLCDLVTALGGGTTAGPHWIVNNIGELFVKRIGVTEDVWTKYYGDSEANATLVAGVDFFDGDFQPVGKEANVIVYYGQWRRPSNGDRWTEPIDNADAAAMWGTDATSTRTREGTVKCVNNYSLKVTTSGAGNPINAFYPSSEDAALNLASFTTFNVPYMHFYFYVHNAIGAHSVALMESDTKYFFYTFTASILAQDTWYHLKLPVGPHYKTAEPTFVWSETAAPNAPNWNNINKVSLITTDSGANGDYFCVDGLHFGGTPLIRIARQEFHDEVVAGRGTLGYDGSAGETPANPIRFKVLTDNIGKDDSLKATDDSGLMAQLAKAELLRACKATINGKFTTPMIKDILPGQYVHIEKDYRITKLIHTIEGKRFTTYFEVTDDLTNSHTRLRYEDINKIYASIRPEYQDRQSSSIKSGDMDIRIIPLEKPYDI